MIPNPLLTILITVVLPPLLAGQSPPEKLKLRTLSLGSSAFPPLWAMEGTSPVPIPFSSVQPSAPLQVDRENPMRMFMGELNDKGLPADPTPTLLKLPPSSSILLLGWIVEEKPRFFAVPDAFADARSDDWIVINSAKVPVAIQIGTGTKPTSVKPGSHAPIRVTAPVNEGAAVIAAIRKGEGWKTIYSTYWPIYPDKRCLIIIVQDGEKMRIKVIADEFKKPAPAEP